MWSTSLIFDSEATDSIARRAASICRASNRAMSSSESRGPLAPAAAYAVPSGGEREVAVRMEAVEGALEALRTEVSLSVRTELGALHAALGTLGQELHAAIELVQGVKVSSEHAEGAGGVPLLHAGGQDSFSGTDHAGELAALQAQISTLDSAIALSIKNLAT